jgi:hypothetical protein
MAKTIFIFQIDIGFDPERGYAAAIRDVALDRMKGIRANSPEQLCSRIRNVVLEEFRKKRDFPLESERSEPSRIIMP